MGEVRPLLDQWMIGIASVVAQRATCLRRSVGCVLANGRGHIIATGYNGRASGLPHCNESIANACAGAYAVSGTDLDECEAIHAEQNALLQCRDVHEITTCYTTLSPCLTCTKLLLNTSCWRIVFVEQYAQIKARDLWLNAGRDWFQITPGLSGIENLNSK